MHESGGSAPTQTPAAEVRDLLTRIRQRQVVLGDASTTQGLVCHPKEADRLIEAAAEVSEDPISVVWSGRITERWEFNHEVQSLSLSGAVDGYLKVEGSVVNDVAIGGVIHGDVVIAGAVGGHLSVQGTIERDLEVTGSVGENLGIMESGSVGRDLMVGASASLGDLLVLTSGQIIGSIRIFSSKARRVGVDGSVGGDLLVSLGSQIEKDVQVKGSLSGDIRVDKECSVGEDLFISGQVAGYVSISGTIEGDLAIVDPGGVDGDFFLRGVVAGSVRVSGTVAGRSNLTPRQMLTLSSMIGARFGDEVFIGDLVRIDRCDFRRSPDLDQLHLVGSQQFPDKRRWRPPRLHVPGGSTHAEMVTVYRRLRTNVEGRGNRAGAADFYRGEMRSRFRDAWPLKRPAEAIVIGGYWLLSGFGLSPWRPAVWFVVIAGISSQLLNRNGLGVLKAEVTDGKAFQFAVQSMISFFSPPHAPGEGNTLTDPELWAQIGLRFVGPLLLAQFAFALRERIAR